MRKILVAAMVFAWIAGGATVVRAQDQGQVPKVLLIDREIVKFGKDSGHARNEAAFAKAEAAVKSPDRYLAVTTMSGPSEAWFLVGYDSFAEWQKSREFENQPKMDAIFDPLFQKDAEYISDSDQTVVTYNEKWSYKPDVDMASMRYFEIERIVRKPGHEKDWEDLMALYLAAATKANIDEHDIFFESRYGAPDGTVYIFTPRASLADLDVAMGTGKQFEEALGPDGQKKWAELIAATIASDNSMLVRFSPEMSYPPEAWVKADPGFWKPKAAAAPKPAAPAAAPDKKKE